MGEGVVKCGSLKEGSGEVGACWKRSGKVRFFSLSYLIYLGVSWGQEKRVC